MNRDSPRQTDGILPEHTFYFFRDLLRFFVQHILIIPPFFGQQLKDITTVFSTYGHSFFVNTHHFAYHAVIVTFFWWNVILKEHDLCSFFDCKHFIRRVRVLRKISLYLRPKTISPSGQWCQFTVVHLLGLIVMRCQSDIPFFFPWTKTGLITTIQFVQHFIICFIFAYLVQKRKKESITLTVDFL